MLTQLTFRDGVLNLSALGDDAVVVDALLLFEEVVAVAAVLLGASAVGLRREPDLGDEQPLEEGEGDADDGGDGDQDLRYDVGEDHFGDLGGIDGGLTEGVNGGLSQSEEGAGLFESASEGS